MSMNASSPTPEVPLEIEPIVGWRVWRLGRNFLGDLRLKAVVHQHEWEPQSVEPAVCAARQYRQVDAHTPPSETCSCGYYAADSLASLAAARVFTSGVSVIGAIAMWGGVVEHANGARSEFAYPARLRLVCTRCIEGGVVVDPTVVHDDGGALRPLCHRHAKGRGGQFLPADLVQAELLSTYAVDLLPKPKLPRFHTGTPRSSAKGAATTALVGFFMLLRLVIGFLFTMWLLSIALAMVAVIFGAIANVVTGGSSSQPTPAVSVVHQPAVAPYATHEWHRVAPHHGPPPPPPMVAPAFPCGIGHGDTVELVSCVDPRTDLIGLAMQEAPHGMAHDCIPADVAYSTGRTWWVCWFPLHDAWVHPWPHAPNPFHTDGGAPDGDR
jgi:hypothetical protein